jgi:hypothetical protein
MQPTYAVSVEKIRNAIEAISFYKAEAHGHALFGRNIPQARCQGQASMIEAVLVDFFGPDIMKLVPKKHIVQEVLEKHFKCVASHEGFLQVQIHHDSKVVVGLLNPVCVSLLGGDIITIIVAAMTKENFAELKDAASKLTKDLTFTGIPYVPEKSLAPIGGEGGK